MAVFDSKSFGGLIVRWGRRYIGGITMAGDAKLLYYNAAGEQVPEDDPSATKQYRSDDPLRPDSGAKPASGVFSITPEADAPEEKAQDAPAENKARKSSANK